MLLIGCACESLLIQLAKALQALALLLSAGVWAGLIDGIGSAPWGGQCLC